MDQKQSDMMILTKFSSIFPILQPLIMHIEICYDEIIFWKMFRTLLSSNDTKYYLERNNFFSELFYYYTFHFTFSN